MDRHTHLHTFVCFSIRITIRYLCTLTPPFPIPPILSAFNGLNSLRYLFRPYSLHASALCLPFVSRWVWDIVMVTLRKTL